MFDLSFDRDHAVRRDGTALRAAGDGMRTPVTATLALLAAMATTAIAPPRSAAQGIAPGGSSANTTGIGSGLGTPQGTGPVYPNGTQQPSLPPPVPPGGLPPSGRFDNQLSPSPPLRLHVQTPQRYPEPRDPNDPTAPAPATPAAKTK